MGNWNLVFQFSISVLDLTNIDLATEEDKSYNIDKWASLFKAQTWEEIKMLAEKNESIDEAAKGKCRTKERNCKTTS